MSKFLGQMFAKLKSVKQARVDASLNRVLKGVDRQGNRYYQHYDENGNENKRKIDPYDGWDGFSIDYDQYWDPWLRGTQDNPFTQEELDKFYAAEDRRFKVGMDYEIKDADMMKTYREEYRKKNENNKTKLDKGYSESFEPGNWKPGSKK